MLCCNTLYSYINGSCEVESEKKEKVSTIPLIGKRITENPLILNWVYLFLAVLKCPPFKGISFLTGNLMLVKGTILIQVRFPPNTKKQKR